MCYERVAKDREFPEDDGASLSGIEPAQIVTVIATVPTAMARCSLSIARPTRGVLPAVKDSKGRLRAGKVLPFSRARSGEM
jgi:hypothetical protein